MKGSCLKFLFVILLGGVASISHAQDSIFITRPPLRYNASKGGFLLSKITASYERAIIPYLSVGLSGDYHYARFKGFSGNLFVRGYALGFHRSGPYLEAKGTYGYYNPICYASRDSYGLHGQHRADITGVSLTVSLGYKWVWRSGFMMETGFGFRGSNATFGADDIYFETAPIVGDYTYVKDVFYGVGPGGPVAFMFNIGYCF